ncbi:MAG: hypothetical protein ACPGQS_10175, partial [Bradymonadia bacterium]
IAKAISGVWPRPVMTIVVKWVVVPNNSHFSGKKMPIALTLRVSQSLSVHRVDCVEERWPCKLLFPSLKYAVGVRDLQ